MLKTNITQILGIKYPIIGGTMMSISKADFVADISNAGGLGILASAIYKTKNEFADAVDRIKELTDKPFAVNINLFPSMTSVDNNDYVDVLVEKEVKIVETSGHSAPAELCKRFKDAGMTDKLTDSVLISDEEIRQLPWKGKGFEVTKKNGEWERALIDKYEVLIAEDITRSQIKSSLHYLLVTNDREKIFAGINSAVRRILQKLINNQTLKLKDWKKISQLLSQYLHDEDDLYTLPCKVDTKDVLDRIRRLLVKIKSLNTKSSLREVAEIYQEFAYLQPFLSTSTRLGRVLRDY